MNILIKIFNIFLYFFVINNILLIESFCPYSIAKNTFSSITTKLSNTWEGQIPEATDKSNPLVDLNYLFQDMYSIAQNDLMPSPVIFQEGDYLVLYLDPTNSNSRIVEQQIPLIYHNLKMVSHMPLAVFMILLPNINNNIEKDTLNNLILYKNKFDNITLTRDLFDTDEQYIRQLKIYDETKIYMNQIIINVKNNNGIYYIDENKLYDWVYGLNIELNDNLNDAAQSQIDLLNKVVMKWKKTYLNGDKWDNLKIALSSSHMALPEYIVAQYFSRLFDVPIHYNDRFFTFENANNENDVLTLMETHETDYAIGDAFFQDHLRMHRDALSDGARIALDNLFGPDPDDDWSWDD